MKKKIQIFKYKSFNTITNKDLANNIVNGIILNGFLKVVKWKKQILKNKNKKWKK